MSNEVVEIDKNVRKNIINRALKEIEIGNNLKSTKAAIAKRIVEIIEEEVKKDAD